LPGSRAGRLFLPASHSTNGWIAVHPPPPGFSLAYNAGTALGGSAPAIVSAISLALQDRAPLASRLAPAVWLCGLSVPAAGAALALLRLAPRVNRCGRAVPEDPPRKGRPAPS
jgi:hypothetical protein